MGIIIDNQVLDLKGSEKEGTTEEKVVKECISKIRAEFKGRFPLKITFGDHMAFEKTAMQGGREFKTMGYPSLRQIPVSCDIILNNSRVNVRYFNAERRNNGELEYFPRKLKFTGSMNIRETELDLAFYMLYCVGNVENAKDVSSIKRINEQKGAKDFTLIDTFKINTDEIRFNKTKAAVENAIANEMEDNKIKKIATFYGLSQVDNKPAEVLRNELIRHLNILTQTTGDKISVYDEFNLKFEKMMTSEGGIEANIRALISRAIENKCIQSRKITGQNAQEWCYTKDNGARGERIHKVMPDKGEVESLVIFLTGDEKVRRELEDYVRSMVGNK